uniref:Uncharacterized protein n=1 Tax=Arundo donax TaxID=35708 RepID=A0A0A9T5B7_ARUDO
MVLTVPSLGMPLIPETQLDKSGRNKPCAGCACAMLDPPVTTDPLS